jgi:hypothetical protein
VFACFFDAADCVVSGHVLVVHGRISDYVVFPRFPRHGSVRKHEHIPVLGSPVTELVVSGVVVKESNTSPRGVSRTGGAPLIKWHIGV